ncbi:hypothetical protein J4E90_007054 [Alternaria incomplexa]|uniref:uncharacterized protein n=1 Tax=Alternaria incomplexa TaxID=1187928 RepID=UPI002220801C|nr:uncharacterized protein J4E90_007054 [Alternaria incomplexa]KAI4910798.1 hypothetical protein J4E90_007054 [Alternaria incomplexa]
MAFRFLDLNPELRNIVYHFASITDAHVPIRCDASLQSGNYAALTRVCVQIRREYRPVQRYMAEVRLDLANVGHYARAFMTTAEDSMSLPHTIHVEAWFAISSRSDSHFSIFPVLKLKATHPDLDCKMVPAAIANRYGLAQHPMFFGTVNQVRGLNALACHANEKWREEIRNGTIGDVRIRSSASFSETTCICIIFTGVHAPKNYDEAISAPDAWSSARGLDVALSHGHHVALYLSPMFT